MTDVDREEAAQFRHRPGLRQPGHEGVEARIERIEAPGGGRLAGDRLEFEDGEVVGVVERQVVGARAQRRLQRHGAQVEGTLALGVGGMMSDLRVEIREQARENVTDTVARRTARQLRHVGAGMDDPAVRPLHGEEEAVRLHASEDVDRLPVAGGQFRRLQRQRDGTQGMRSPVQAVLDPDNTGAYPDRENGATRPSRRLAPPVALPLGNAAHRTCDRNRRVRSSCAAVKKVLGGPCSTITPRSVK